MAHVAMTHLLLCGEKEKYGVCEVRGKKKIREKALDFEEVTVC